MIEDARNKVRGKSVRDALFAFANIWHGARESEIRKYTQKMVTELPSYVFFSEALIRHDRIIGKRPTLDSGDINSSNNQAVVWAEMVKHYEREIGLAVQGAILPALEVVLLEHRIREHDFVAIAIGSLLVQPDRALLFGKAIFSGFDGDFAVALHLLIPQIENMVRYRLKIAGARTTRLDKDGIETENGLSALMELPEVTKIFDEDLAFELKALFCNPWGPNLRNELAHGLLGHAGCNSYIAVYAWWFGLRIVFNTYWNAQRLAQSEQETVSQTSPSRRRPKKAPKPKEGSRR